jgi:putative acetyltransferase
MAGDDGVTIAREVPRQADVIALIDALDAYQTALYPAESNHFLDLAALEAPDIRFFVARRNGAAIGCGALRVMADYGEIKRMFVRPEARGLKIGRRILDVLETTARRERLACLHLETGIYQPEAIGLYRVAGFVERGPYGGYAPDPLSLFMEKRL